MFVNSCWKNVLCHAQSRRPNQLRVSCVCLYRAARAFGEYLSHTHPENQNGSGHLVKSPLGHLQPPAPSITTTKTRLSLERSFSAEEDQQKCVECALQPARVYTITGEHSMLGSNRGSKESLELEVLKGASTLVQPSTSPSSTSSPHPAPPSPWTPWQHSSRRWEPSSRQPCCRQHWIVAWSVFLTLRLSSALSPCVSPSLPLWSGLVLCPLRFPIVAIKLLKTYTLCEDNNWYPKENMFSFQTASTTMQANFRKHLRMVGSRRMKAQTFAERRAKSFNRSWSDPTPVKNDSSHDTRDSESIQSHTLIDTH
uniref:Uncharacterized protein n=1 Tax=Oncorhynchus tshawytscha TaxID=74940 RepID=A0AAZ3QL68_ONCTS